jgi:hypothetical protein
MPRKPSARVVMNREAVAAIRLGEADGLQAAAERIQALVQPPDAAPYGKGLVQGGGVVTFVDGKRVASSGKGSPPRRDIPKVMGTVFGWLFPARFNELGTVRQPARPFFTPAIQEGLPDVADEVAEAIEQRLQGVADRRAARQP